MVSKYCVLLLALAGLSEACWWTMCQPKNWAVRGCNDASTEESVVQACPGGDMYKCCPKGTAGGGDGGGVINGGSGLLSRQEFNGCVQAFGYPAPSQAIFNSFNSRAQKDGGMTNKLEAFMAVAQLAHESAGFTARREWACSNGRWESQCTTYDRNGCPGQYFGRGFIQLTHCYNYRPASLALYGDERLVQNPDLVATDDDAGMATAMWYWKSRVHNSGGSEGAFGKTTCAINCGWDCKTNPNIGRTRWQLFNKCLQQAGNGHLRATENGCYN